MTELIDEGRRTFLKAGVATAGGFVIGFYFPLFNKAWAAPVEGEVFRPNAWIRIGSDSAVTFVTARSEMGQGVMTALPMLIAEELEIDLARVRTEWAPADPAYINPILGAQVTGGSTSVRGAWKPLRQAGAAARTMLMTAAAQTWGVPESSCKAQDGAIVHAPSGRRLNYGELADKAARLPVPEVAFLKERSEFHLIGHPAPRLDVPDKVDGSAGFGLDVRVPQMLIATVARCPVFGGKVAAFDDRKARAVTGVRQTVTIDSGVAVVADSFWQAKRGHDALSVQWDEGPHASLSSDSIRKQFIEAARKPGVVARDEGTANQVLESAARRIEAVYEVPYQAHVTMEPMNCTAHVREDGCDIWVPTQAQGPAQQVAAKLTNLPMGAIRIHTTYLGGGFGRRSEQDFVTEAVQISQAVGAPVKVVWTREDDIHHDFYRPATYNRLAAGIDKSGNLVAWAHRIVGPSIMSRALPKMVKNGIDPSSVEGAANLPYAVPNIHVDYLMQDVGVPVGFWRSVGNSQNIFITESFIDEIAAATRADPYRFRAALLRNAPRHRAVLDLAAKQAGWSRPLAKGRYRGIAVGESFGSYVAQVAEISVSKDAGVRVHRVVCAIDCGTVVNPNTVVAQMESGIVYGLTAALKGAITLQNGRVMQNNFDTYPLLRFNEMPDIQVHIVPSEEGPGGVGEPGVPPIAPAVANAVFAATGKRMRRLPIRPQDLFGSSA